MQYLDHTLMSKLRQLNEEAGASFQLYAVEYEESIVLCNNLFLLEWPIKEVDTTCTQYQKMKLAAKARGTIAEKILRSHWRDELIHDGDIVEAYEAHPLDHEFDFFLDKIKNPPFVAQIGLERVYYNVRFYDMIVLAFGDFPELAVYLPSETENTASFIAYLCVLDAGKLVGVVCNHTISDPGDVLVVDEVTGRAAVIDRRDHGP